MKKKLKIVFFDTCIEKWKGEILIWKGPNEHQQHTIRKCQQAIKAHNKEVTKTTKGQRGTYTKQRGVNEQRNINKQQATRTHNKNALMSINKTQQGDINEQQKGTNKQ